MIVILALAAITIVELLIWREAKAQKRRHENVRRWP